MKLIPTILCGGAGSRLWPVSREMHPKPFIRLADGQSLLQKAWLRGAVLPETVEVMTVTNRELFFKAKDDYREIAESRKIDLPNGFILEPFGRNTAPAIVAAAITVAEKYGPEALLLVLAADHLIADQEAFAQAVARATTIAQQGKLVTFGIQPDMPETGYGYIEADMARSIMGNNGSVIGFDVCRFVEKPSLDKAREYLASGNYQWNSGMFCFSAGVLLQEMDQYRPDILAATRACLSESQGVVDKGGAQIQLDPDGFAHVPDDSIDYALMEKSANVAVVTCAIGWSDIGSWDVLGNLTSPDAKGNRIEGEAVLHEVNDCYIRSRERMVGAVGVDNLIVIDTPDALLVADRNRTQEVKHLYANLKASGHEAYKIHRTVNRPWGSYTVLETGPNFKIKRIEVKPNASLSLQMHYHRSEHWIVVSGMARVTRDDIEILVNTNESTYIPAGHKHRLENPGMLPLVMIEVQSGTYLGEDDIVRFDDIYGRVPNEEEGASN